MSVCVYVVCLCVHVCWVEGDPRLLKSACVCVCVIVSVCICACMCQCVRTPMLHNEEAGGPEKQKKQMDQLFDAKSIQPCKLQYSYVSN